LGNIYYIYNLDEIDINNGKNLFKYESNIILLEINKIYINKIYKLNFKINIVLI